MAGRQQSQSKGLEMWDPAVASIVGSGPWGGHGTKKTRGCTLFSRLWGTGRLQSRAVMISAGKGLGGDTCEEAPGIEEAGQGGWRE